eukprot:7244979-Prymnesium_polylepis.1
MHCIHVVLAAFSGSVSLLLQRAGSTVAAAVVSFYFLQHLGGWNFLRTAWEKRSAAGDSGHEVQPTGREGDAAEAHAKKE